MDPAVTAGAIGVAVLSITTHEAAHGFTADRLGDPTARQRGRVTLNPLPHIDPVLTILLPAALILSGSGFIFGGAKPVPVDVSRLRNPRHDWALVGVAGPVSNLLIAALLAGVLSLMLKTGLWDRGSAGTQIAVIGMFVNALLAMFVNALLAMFNLIPVPPLDGSRVVQYFLPPAARRLYAGMDRFGLLILIALVLWVPGMQRLLLEAVLLTVSAISGAFGISADVAAVARGILRG